MRVWFRLASSGRRRPGSNRVRWSRLYRSRKLRLFVPLLPLRVHVWVFGIPFTPPGLNTLCCCLFHAACIWYVSASVGGCEATPTTRFVAVAPLARRSVDSTFSRLLRAVNTAAHAPLWDEVSHSLGWHTEVGRYVFVSTRTSRARVSLSALERCDSGRLHFLECPRRTCELPQDVNFLGRSQRVNRLHRVGKETAR